MSKRLSGNRSAVLPMTRGEYNRNIKEARKNGMTEGYALGRKALIAEIKAGADSGEIWSLGDFYAWLDKKEKKAKT